MNKEKLTVALAIIIPVVGGILYAKLKHKKLTEENTKLTLERERLIARNKVLEEQNQDLFKHLDENNSKK